MSTIDGTHDAVNPGALARITGLFWSKHRCYHGDTVTLSVVTHRANDGASVEIKLFARAAPRTVVDTITGLTVASNRVDHDYTVDLKDKPFPPDARDFFFVASFAGRPPAGRSEPIYVELEAPRLSV